MSDSTPGSGYLPSFRSLVAAVSLYVLVRVALYAAGVDHSAARWVAAGALVVGLFVLGPVLDRRARARNDRPGGGAT